MEWRVVYRVLHSLTLFIYATIVWFYTYVLESKSIFSRFHSSPLNSTDSPFLMVDRPIQNLDHIVFVIYEDNLSIATICHLIIICINLQIRDISIIAKSMSNSHVSKMVTSHLRKTHGAVCLESDTDKNVLRYRVYSKERSSNVQFLDLNSGHNMLSSAAKSISSSGISITPDMVEKTLQNTFPMSPVSLTLIFGPPSLAGLLPWQSIDTEILKWSSHTEMSSSDFINILHTYCAIVKRWGR